MIVLIVDDQTNVVSGLFSGINWDRLQVTKVLKAYNTFEAKDILENQSVDVMLCDIEMPEEDGISLMRWVKRKGLPVECIFLTAHADFMYAKEAIQLGSFDYILQPARYEDIEKSLLRARQKIMNSRRNQELSSYGQILYEKKYILVDSILRDWVLEKETEPDNVLKDLQKLNIEINSGSTFYLVLFNILRWHSEAEYWEVQLLKSSFRNILSELYEHYGQKVLLTELDKDNFLFLLYNRNNQLIDEGGLIRQLEYFIQVSKNIFQCSISCYTGDKTSPVGASAKIKLLMKMKNDNVALQSKVFFEGREETEKVEVYELHRVKHWTDLLTAGNIGQAREEILTYLSKLSEKGMLGAESLRIFYQTFLQMLFQAAEQLNIPLYPLFKDREIPVKSLSSYHTVEQTCDFINEALDFLEQSRSAEIDTKKQIGLIVQYIHYNIEKDIRRNEIAEAVFLNPDYLSRLFKKEMRVPLKEYITECKVKEAQTLLKTTDLPVSIIAAKVGYTNFSHFSQVYKKVTGISPADDRN